MGTSTTTTYDDGSLVIGDETLPIGQLDPATGALRLYDADGDAVLTYDPEEALLFLDGLRAHEQQLRDAARKAQERRQWDKAYAVARNLIHQGVDVQGIQPRYDSDLHTYVIEVDLGMDGGPLVREHSGGVEIRVEAWGSVSQQARATVRPGVVLVGREPVTADADADTAAVA